MTENIADILDDCLESLLRGDSVESCLARHPDLAGELEPLLRIAALTMDLSRVAPDPARKKAAKQRFLARTRADIPPAPGPIPFPGRFRLVAVPLAAAFLLAIVLAGAIAVSADSTPDDAAYPIKRAAETVQLVFSYGDQRTARHIELADRRLGELERIADRKGIVHTTLLADLTKETKEVVAGLDRAERKEELGKKLFELTARQQQVLRRVAATSPVAAAEGLDRALEESKDAHEVAATAIAKERLHELEEEAETAAPTSTATRAATAARADTKPATPTGTPPRPSPTAKRDESDRTKGGDQTRTPTASAPTPAATATKKPEEEQRTPTVRAATPTPKGREDDDDRRQPIPSATPAPSSTPQPTPRSGAATATPRPPQPTPTAYEKDDDD